MYLNCIMDVLNIESYKPFFIHTVPIILPAPSVSGMTKAHEMGPFHPMGDGWVGTACGMNQKAWLECMFMHTLLATAQQKPLLGRHSDIFQAPKLLHWAFLLGQTEQKRQC
jgi:hypothetical protein